MRTLILGGVRSGKSRLAETLARESGLAVTYIATAQIQIDGALDDEMMERVLQHRARRPVDWQSVEEPLLLAGTLRRHASADRCLLVDCLTLWLTNLLIHPDAGLFARERAALLDTLLVLPGTIILVGNETGMGIVPLGELTRRYCDEAGLLHQEIAACCDDVFLTVAGLPLTLKGAS